jgi:hypothetical protein
MPDCSRGITIATVKGGRYRCYKWAAKVNGGAVRCSCPTLRDDRLDEIVVDAMEERILAPARLTTLLSSVLEISHAAEARRRSDLNHPQKAKKRIKTLALRQEREKCPVSTRSGARRSPWRTGLAPVFPVIACFTGKFAFFRPVIFSRIEISPLFTES